MADFTYGNEGVGSSPGTPAYAAEQEINERFGKSNMMLALVPTGNNLTEKAMSEEIDDLPYVKYALGLASALPDGIPEDFLPHSITKKLHTEDWARVIINVRSSGESDKAFEYANNIRDIVKKYYPQDQTYLIGVTTSTQDIKEVITTDYNHVNAISLLGVALVVALTFKAFVLPFVVLIPIEAAVYLNTALPYILGQRIMFLGFIVVSCVQLGATIDYSILMTNNYLDARSQSPKKEAAIRAVTASASSVLTSGCILMTVAYALYFLSTVEAIGSLGRLIGRGALFSVILVLFMLPACLMAFDRFIVKPDYATKKHARMNRIHATKLVLPKLSDLHKQQLKLREQLRANRRARHRATAKKLKQLFGLDTSGKHKANTRKKLNAQDKPRIPAPPEPDKKDIPPVDTPVNTQKESAHVSTPKPIENTPPEINTPSVSKTEEKQNIKSGQHRNIRSAKRTPKKTGGASKRAGWKPGHLAKRPEIKSKNNKPSGAGKEDKNVKKK